MRVDEGYGLADKIEDVGDGREAFGGGIQPVGWDQRAGRMAVATKSGAEFYNIQVARENFLIDTR
jgi:hypothetical protein